jgi:hypothetical protein
VTRARDSSPDLAERHRVARSRHYKCRHRDLFEPLASARFRAGQEICAGRQPSCFRRRMPEPSQQAIGSQRRPNGEVACHLIGTGQLFWDD